ncbi:MAG: hypothetical protein E7521_00485 [Ruminococcaceae bacterium]|nr:hypothetical protein [Oscillospiraceae bacterium]
MKNQRKIIVVGIISNIILSVLYAICSWFASVFGLLFLTALSSNNWSVLLVFQLIACILLVATPIFSIVGIVLSVIMRKKEKFTFSFLIQFLPFLTCGFSIFLTVICMIFGNP